MQIENGVETVDLVAAANMPSGDAGELFCYNLLTQQAISDKTVADAVEALIGIYLATYGPVGAVRFLNWFGLKVDQVHTFNLC